MTDPTKPPTDADSPDVLAARECFDKIGHKDAALPYHPSFGCTNLAPIPPQSPKVIWPRNPPVLTEEMFKELYQGNFDPATCREYSRKRCFSEPDPEVRKLYMFGNTDGLVGTRAGTLALFKSRDAEGCYRAVNLETRKIEHYKFIWSIPTDFIGELK